MSALANEDTMKANHQGFTLIELMIVVAIVAILAAIAYPSYLGYVKRGSRAEAKAALFENMQFLERNFTVSNKYNETSGGDAIDTASLPAQQTPPSPATAKFTLEVDPEASTYTLTATPTGAMSGDECGVFIIDQAGAKSLDDATLSVAECWGK